MPAPHEIITGLQQFEIKSDLSLEKCHSRLWELDQSRRFMQLVHTEVNIYERTDRQYNVRMYAHRHYRFWNLTSIEMAGVLAETADGKTVLTGQVQFSIYYYVGLLLPIIGGFLFAAGNRAYTIIGVIFAIGLPLFVIGLVHSDRQQLLDKIESAMR